MTEQDRIIEAIHAADITVDDWWYPIKESITSQYAKGYLTGRIEGYHDFDFRDRSSVDDLVKWCTYSIWE